MGKFLELKLRINKKNGQVNTSIPRRKLSVEDKKKLCSYKTAKVWLEGFE